MRSKHVEAQMSHDVHDADSVCMGLLLQDERVLLLRCITVGLQ